MREFRGGPLRVAVPRLEDERADVERLDDPREEVERDAVVRAAGFLRDGGGETRFAVLAI